MGEKIKNMPIKRVMVLFIIAALLLASITSVVTIMSTYSIRAEQMDLGNYEVVDIINGFLYLMILVYIIGFIIIAVYLFYNIKLRHPLKQLMGGTIQISQNNLDFTMDYKSKDELGQLCASFEKMKTELRQNNARMWLAAEERKKLNAVFAHDLRTPLTVLKGYTDFWEEYIPSAQMQPDKLLKTTEMMSRHIERIEQYVHMMSTIQRVEDTPVLQGTITGKSISDLLQSIVNNHKKQTEITLSCETALYEVLLNIDTDTVQRIMDNLLSNAMRYATSKIEVAAYMKEDYFVLSVTDDGCGFALEYSDNAFTPFYQKDKADHFGLGLYICKTLCQNHGGRIKIGNIASGGAKIVVTLKIR